MNRAPDYLKVNAEIFVRQPITHASHLLPWNRFVSVKCFL